MKVIHVDSASKDLTKASYTQFWCEETDVQLQVWRMARLIDLGGPINVCVYDENDVKEWRKTYVRLADVPRPVLRVYWRVDAIDGSLFPFFFKKDTRAAAEEEISRHKYISMKITRVTVRPKRVR